MKSKYAIFFNIKVMKTERSAFWGNTRYNTILLGFAGMYANSSDLISFLTIG